MRRFWAGQGLCPVSHPWAGLEALLGPPLLRVGAGPVPSPSFPFPVLQRWWQGSGWAFAQTRRMVCNRGDAFLVSQRDTSPPSLRAGDCSSPGSILRRGASSWCPPRLFAHAGGQRGPRPCWGARVCIWMKPLPPARSAGAAVVLSPGGGCGRLRSGAQPWEVSVGQRQLGGDLLSVQIRGALLSLL